MPSVDAASSEPERIPLAVPDLRGREREYLVRCVEDNWVSSAGPFVTEFEGEIARLCHRCHGVAVVNGTAALHLALAAVGAGPGRLVVVPDWTFAATANAVFHAGARPCFVDVDPQTWTLDPALLGETIARHRDSLAAVICVHTLGHAADMDAIVPICRAAGIPLIEDAAGAIGASYKNAPLGSFGDAACLSFNGNKLVTAGGGGMVVTDDADLARRLRHLSTQARLGDEYRHDDVGFNYRMTNVNAAVGLAQLERLDEMLAAKRAIAARYDAALGALDGVRPMPRANWTNSNCWLYSVLLPSEAAARVLVDQLKAQRIEARIFWRALSAQSPYAAAPKRLSGVAADLSGRVVSLPCSSNLNELQQLRVIDIVKSWHARVAMR